MADLDERVDGPALFEMLGGEAYARPGPCPRRDKVPAATRIAGQQIGQSLSLWRWEHDHAQHPVLAKVSAEQHDFAKPGRG